MADQWIIKVEGKEYGPADVETLQEWKEDGRVLPANEARRSDTTQWTVASEIPGLFETAGPPPIQKEPAEPRRQRPLREILGQTLSIYRRGFFRFLGLTLLVVGPSICAQLMEAWINSTLTANADIGKVAAGAFAFCMTLLTLVLWPIYIAGIQILSVELSGQNPVGFLGVLNGALKFWPRVASLSLVVYGVFGLLFAFAFGIMLLGATGGPGLPVALLLLTLLVIQVTLFSRWFANTLFWQQTAVLGGAEPVESLRSSRRIARSGPDLPWFRRPLWRGAFIASIWVAFAMAIEMAAAWPMFQQSFSTMSAPPDFQTLLDTMKAAQAARGLDLLAIVLSLGQAILRPLLGIAFVLLYLDSKVDEPPDSL